MDLNADQDLNANSDIKFNSIRVKDERKIYITSKTRRRKGGQRREASKDRKLNKITHGPKVDGSDLVILAQLLELLLGARLHLGPVLAEGLELVDELIDHVPKPLVGKLHVHVAVQNDLQKKK